MHTLYTGVTQSGKTTMARLISRQLAAQGQTGIVFDPMGTHTAGGGWGFKEIHHDPYVFLERLEDPKLTKAHVFVDEAHKLLGHEMKENFWMMTEGRHFGLFMHILTQRPNKVHPDVRSQCERCYMFRLAQDDAAEIGKDYGHSGVHKISLDKGDFLLFNSGSAAIQRGNVFQLTT
jgi:hypothetical protein